MVVAKRLILAVLTRNILLEEMVRTPDKFSLVMKSSCIESIHAQEGGGAGVKSPCQKLKRGLNALTLNFGAHTHLVCIRVLMSLFVGSPE